MPPTSVGGGCHRGCIEIVWLLESLQLCGGNAGLYGMNINSDNNDEKAHVLWRVRVDMDSAL